MCNYLVMVILLTSVQGLKLESNEILGLPMCTKPESTETTQCLEIGIEKMTWMAAHQHCRSIDGFLATRDHLSGYLKSEESKNELWTSLTYVGPILHSISEVPGFVYLETFEGIPIPYEGEENCVKLSNGSVNMEDCNSELSFICSRPVGREKIHHVVELEIVKNEDVVNRVTEVDSSEMSLLVLECRLKKSYESGQSNQPHMFWRKNGVWLGHSGRFIQPSTVKDISKDTMGNPEPTYQGTYCCGTWNSNDAEISTSDCVTVVLNSHVSFAVSLYYDFSSGGLKSRDLLRVELGHAVAFFQAVIPGTVLPYSNATFSLISITSPKSDVAENTYVINFNLYISKKIIMCSNVAVHAARSLLRTSQPESDIKLVFCDSSKSSISVPGSPCSGPVQSACPSVYTEGVSCSEPPRFCPRGYILVASDRICVKVLEAQSWTDAFGALTPNPNRISLVSKHLIKESAPYDDLVGELLISNITLVWLPFRRMRIGGPIVALQKDDQQFIYNLFKHNFSRFSWYTNEPAFENCCVALNLITNSMYTKNCKMELPTIDILPPTLFDRMIPLPWSTSNYCPDGWSHTLLGECIKVFLKSVSSAGEAEEFCNYENSRVVIVHDYLSAYMYRSLLKERSINSIWVKIMPTIQFEQCLGSNIPKRSNQNPEYSVLDQEKLETHGKVNVIACVRHLEDTDQTLHIEIRGNRLIAESSRIHNNNAQMIKCFRNGFPIPVVSTSTKRFETTLAEEGVYQCILNPSSKLGIYSNKITYQLDSKMAIAIEASTTITYRPIKRDSTIIKKNKLLDPKCATSILEVFNHTNLNHGRTWNPKVNLQYYFEKNRLLYMLLHLEFEKENMSERYFLDHVQSFLSSKHLKECRIETIKSTSGCYEQNFITDTNISLSWSEVQHSGTFPPRELCVSENGKLVTRKCSGDLVVGYKWEDPIGDCYQQIDNETSSLYLIQTNPIKHLDGKIGQLSNKVRREETSEADIYYVASTFKKLCDNIDKSKNLGLHEVVQTMDNLLVAQSDRIESCQDKFNTSSILLDTFEELVFNTVRSNASEETSVEKSLIVVRYLESKNSSVIGFKINTLRNTSVINRGDNTSLQDLRTAIMFPESLVDHHELLFIVYDNDKLFHDANAVSQGKKVEGEVISATYRNLTILNLQPEESIRLFFRVPKVSQKTECVFWDFQRNQHRGGWSTEGCNYDGIKDGIAICRCNHLTSFALLITYRDARATEGKTHAMALEAISLVGCSLSIFGLALVLLTFLLFKRWRKPLSNKILANLSFAILASMVIFVAGTSQTESIILCRGVALSLHYFILASFSWMVVESVHQYLRFVKVIGIYIPRFMWKASLCAWGAPLVPVISVLGYDIDIYGGYTSKSNTICWMTGEGFFYAFLPPLGLTMLLNIIFFGIILRSTFCTKSEIKSTLSKRDLLKNQLAMAIFVFFLLGFTWIFAFFSIFEMKIIFSYLFCIFNTLQGFIIFVFHFSRDRQVKYLWFSWVCGMTTKSSLASRSSSRSTKSWSMNERSRMSTKSSGSYDSHSSYRQRSSKRAREQIRRGRSTFV